MLQELIAKHESHDLYSSNAMQMEHQLLKSRLQTMPPYSQDLVRPDKTPKLARRESESATSSLDTTIPLSEQIRSQVTEYNPSLLLCLP